MRSVLAGAVVAAGTGAGLSRGGAQHIDQPAVHTATDGTGPAPSGSVPPIGGTGVVATPSAGQFSGGPIADIGGSHYRPVDASTSWSAGETMSWFTDAAEPPPPALDAGPTVH